MKFLWILLLSLILGCNSSKYNEIRGKDGFWRIAKDRNNTWWLLSPNDNELFYLGITSVRYVQYGIKPPDYNSKDYNGDLDAWAETTSKKVLRYGFNGAGAWSEKSIHKYLPYTTVLNLSLNTTRHISDPLWERDIEKSIAEQVKPNDINLIGYFTDNELDWSVLGPWANKYFEVTSRLIKKYDSNHLILGVRFNKKPSDAVLMASKARIDIHSFNCYTDSGILQLDVFQKTYKITGVPIMISEFSFFSNENDSANPNHFTSDKSQLFGGLVKSQQERADAFHKFVTDCARCKIVLGTEWFQWNDEPPAGRRNDSESYNFGIVDINDNPYILLLNAIKKTSIESQNIHKTIGH